ncbi:hypothetical protein ANACOL_00858 [Anaerotruncus colihominis DSM 17241]|uniref:Uncharacterized protein n=1 Tax=Anaerotruncus colihominis DSM 17241 TaxID=445972 RepID=B0P7W9_9FIRM|nr:hypothetical protein ANACOL_00858 [Anaerotruncus colihominis DSM 17241]
MQTARRNGFRRAFPVRGCGQSLLHIFRRRLFILKNPPIVICSRLFTGECYLEEAE